MEGEEGEAPFVNNLLDCCDKRNETIQREKNICGGGPFIPWKEKFGGMDSGICGLLIYGLDKVLFRINDPANTVKLLRLIYS